MRYDGGTVIGSDTRELEGHVTERGRLQREGAPHSVGVTPDRRIGAPDHHSRTRSDLPSSFHGSRHGSFQIRHDGPRRPAGDGSSSALQVVRFGDPDAALLEEPLQEGSRRRVRVDDVDVHRSAPFRAGRAWGRRSVSRWDREDSFSPGSGAEERSSPLESSASAPPSRTWRLTSGKICGPYCRGSILPLL